MQQQLCLNIIPRLSYAPENFLLHSGVAEIVEQVMQLLESSQFRFIQIEGSARSGKTHLGLYLANRLSSKGIFPQILESNEIVTWYPEARTEIDRESVVIVDDAHSYMSTLITEGSGSFVQLYEHCRKVNARLLFLCPQQNHCDSFDDHVRSRLATLHTFAIAPPEPSDLEGLIHLMARQRGIELSARKQSFLVRRVGRDIESLEKYLNRLVLLSQVLDQRIQFSVLNDALVED